MSSTRERLLGIQETLQQLNSVHDTCRCEDSTLCPPCLIDQSLVDLEEMLEGSMAANLEADDLRRGLEELSFEGAHAADDLQRLLDRVDCRDSLSWMQRRDQDVAAGLQAVLEQVDLAMETWDDDAQGRQLHEGQLVASKITEGLRGLVARQTQAQAERAVFDVLWLGGDDLGATVGQLEYSCALDTVEPEPREEEFALARLKGFLRSRIQQLRTP